MQSCLWREVYLIAQERKRSILLWSKDIFTSKDNEVSIVRSTNHVPGKRSCDRTLNGGVQYLYNAHLSCTVRGMACYDG